MLAYQRVKHMVTQWYTIGFRPAPSIGPPAESHGSCPTKKCAARTAQNRTPAKVTFISAKGTNMTSESFTSEVAIGNESDWV